MDEVYAFIEDVDVLSHRIKNLDNVVIAIIKQTLECALFIREYTGHGFGGTESVVSFLLVFNSLFRPPYWK
jgi:hypothetical protein